LREVLVLSDRVRFKCIAVEIADQDEVAIVGDIVPGEAKEGMFGLEVADLQGAIDLSMQAGTAKRELQFGFGKSQIFQPLGIVEIRQAIQGLLFGVGQNAEQLILVGQR
jgi:hypothetical protein